MSLKVWLPLNGTLENKGLLSLTSSTNIGAVINNSGKIGNCYSFNGSNQRIEFTHDKTIWNNKEMSICMWYKYIEGNTTCTMVDIAADLCLSYTYSSSQVRFNYWRAYSNNGTRTGDSGSGNYYDASKWHHVVLTCDHNMNKIYVDGTLDATFDRSSKYTTNWVPLLGTGYNKITLAKSAGSNPYGSGYLNDVRIYDHCLSPLEVKEIAQGLVLHYKLDDAYIESTTNLCGTGAGGWNNSGTCIRTTNDTAILYPPTSSNTYSIRATSDGSMALTCGTTTANHPSKTIIASVYVWLDGTQDGSSFYLRSSKTDSSVGNLTYNGNANPSTWPQQQWIRINTAPIATASDATTFYICTYINKNTEVRAVNGWQIEEKNHITPYTAPGTTRGTGVLIQDSSGYNHNLTLTGDLLCDNTTPRYSTSMAFNGTAVATAASTGADIRTISCWVKTTKNKNTSQIFVADSKSNMCVSFYNGTIIGVFGTVKNTGSKCTLGSSYKENDWNHIVVVKTSDDGMRDIWCNGEKLAPSSNDYWSAATGMWLGARNASLGNPLYGSLSDVRFYCTPLLDSDIKQLYNVGMKIDKGYNIHTYELQEKNINLFSAIPWTSSYSIHALSSSLFSNFNEYGEPQFTTNGSSAGSNFIVITPGIYEYDYTISVNTGNQFYIGFERYDADKTSRSNAACVYTYATKPSSDVVKQRYKGTVNLSTDGVNPIKYIALRILNGWSGTTSGVTGQATIHNFSLRLVTNTQNPKLQKTGKFLLSELKEDSKASFYANKIVECAEFIEK